MNEGHGTLPSARRSHPVRLGCRWAAVAAIATAVLVWAPAASAVIVSLPNGQAKSYQPLRTAPKPLDAFLQNLDYSGGPVMASNANYTLYWRPAGAPAYPSDYQAGIDQYLTDLAHDSGGAQNVDSVATQYNDAAGHYAGYASTFAGRLLDTNPYPASGCTGAAICLTDAQIQTEISSYLTAHGLPRDLNHQYFLLTPPGVESCFNASGTEGCSAGSSTHRAYCAYHGNSIVGGGEFIYANDGYVTGDPGCDDGNHPNGKTSDGALQGGLSHEHVESITDPEPNNAWTDLGGNTGEIGDKCVGNTGSALGTATNGDLYNQVINGHFYWYQTEWSNQGTACLQRFSFTGTRPTATFTSAASGGRAVAVDATGSTAPGGVAHYDWQFNDGPDPSRTLTETTTPTLTHTFPATGDYTVALTVFAADGTSIGTARTLTVGTDEPPTAAYTPSTYTPALGQTVTFNGGASTDPDGSIVTYRWVWGDGTPDGSGPTPTHAFTTTGLRSVTLRVTDSDGQTSAVGHGITVGSGDEPPTAAYAPSSYAPAVGQAVSFNGGASSDPDGTIAAYRWVWNDGTPDGSGPTATHAFTTTGLRSVSLFVTDSDGQTAAVGHGITVGSGDEPPTAAYAPSSYAPAVGQAVSFNGRASSDPDGTIAAYRWVWNDGTPDGSGPTATHAFTTTGLRSVTLYVTDSDGVTAAVGHGVTVSAGA